MFVLWGDGAVYSVLCYQREDWSVEGPLQILPEDEDNYREEASSICVLGGSAGHTFCHIKSFEAKIIIFWICFNY
jgi:hypothetical protein